MENYSNKDFIKIKGASENNLKKIDLILPKNKLIVFSGLSGSGKSSLAFNTIYEEGKRRYVDSLSSYARQFLGGTKKPNVELIEGLSPSIAIEQKTTHSNLRSTVGTVTEIYDYFRLLFARIGKPFCPKHNEEIKATKTKDIIDQIVSFPLGSKIIILAPLYQNTKGTFANIFKKLKEKGFLRVKVDNVFYSLDDEIILDKNLKHNIDLVIDRIVLKEDSYSRISEDISVALEESGGLVNIEINDKIYNFSKLYSCLKCDFQVPKIETKLFSFNSPYGMCNECKGLGLILEPDLDLLIPNKRLNILNGALDNVPGISSKNENSLEWQKIIALLNYYNIDLEKEIEDYNEKEIEILSFGSKGPISYNLVTKNNKVIEKEEHIEGIVERIKRLNFETSSEDMRNWYSKFMSNIICTKCKGKRLNNYALSIKINNLNIFELSNLSIEKMIDFFKNINLNNEEQQISKLILDEINNRLNFLKNVGLDYLNLTRSAETLSGGEAQRIRLATQIGSKLSGVLYVLDEPSIGLHQSDNEKLIKTLKEMVNLGNTLIVVEHDEETIASADWIVDIGPYAGNEGGEIVAQGTIEDIIKEPRSITGQYFSKVRKIEVPLQRRKGNGKKIEIIGARENNLKNIDVSLPLGLFIVVSGISGSGKSTLINEILVKALEKKLHLGSPNKIGKYKEIKGFENIDKIITINQSPIGRTPRSNPATYTSVFDDIRDVFANVTLAKTRGYDKGRFSFNVSGGRCEKCCGDGLIKIEMHFLPAVYINCDFCNGKRYNNETLEVKFKNKTISDVLEMRVNEAIDFFNAYPKIKTKLQTLIDVGLGYIKLGQSSTTLSGGEAQRIKLSSHLQKRATGKTLFVLDEPTTGLHSYDIQNLLNVLNRLVDQGESVLVIEHNLDVIKSADYIIDLGPLGGEKGGTIVAQGTPEKIAKNNNSLTGQFLKKYLNNK